MGTERILRWLVALALGLPGAAGAQDGVFEAEMRDPWVPPHVREKAMREAAPVLEGGALRAAVEAKLRGRFEAAARDGRLTREEARSAGLLAIARDFDAIDARGSGAIAFDDYKRFLKARGARLD